MFEHHRQPLLTHAQFLRRLLRSAGLAVGIIAVSLVIGMLGYHFIAGLDWVDSFENAAMILSGMGPVDDMPGDGARIFAGSYALFSGVVFLTTVAVLLAPMVHRMLHRLHAATDEDEHEETKRRAKRQP
jgi:TRAP-type C4-dicarboxylate transport system permease small subunit